MKFSKNMNNLDIAELLRDVAAAYQLQKLPAQAGADKNKFKIIAYQRAADAVEHATSELKDLWDDNKLKEIASIGPAIASHLDELFKTGKSKHFADILASIPKSVFVLIKIPGVGVKTAFKLVKYLKLKNNPLKELEKALKEGKLEEIEGFDKESQQRILKAIQTVRKTVLRHPYPYAFSIGSSLIAWLRQERSVQHAEVLGSLRRKVATIGDIDIAVSSNKPKKAIDHFTKYPKAVRILEKGDKTASIILPSNVQVDLMVQPSEAFGSLLQHFTGSKQHNIALREYALKKDLSLSEQGIKKKRKLYQFSTEKDFYKAIGLDFIPPELREDTGEIQAAAKGTLPQLIELSEVKTDLQIHSDFDIETSHDIGVSSMEEIIKEADNLGYEYLAFTEHNPSKSKHKDEQIVEILKKKREKVDEINYSLKTGSTRSELHRVKKVFNSLEIDIMPNGRLPVTDKGLKMLDFALVSIHSSFDLTRKDMTKRVLSALSHSKVKIFAHPTARLLNRREGIELDWPVIFEFCKVNNKWLEINAEPSRLDLPDALVRDAIKLGVKLTLGTDAHNKDSLNNMIYAINVARRGWATKNDIINTQTLTEFEKLLI